jgi:hypothetical protein
MWAVRSPYKKGPFYDAVKFDPSRDNIISMRDDRAHEMLRAKMAAGVRPALSALRAWCHQELADSGLSTPARRTRV